MRRVTLDQAIGLRLGHDITEIDPSKGVKRRAFERGYVVHREDLEQLRNLGKNTVYVMDDDNDGHVHEDDAATSLAPYIAGAGVEFDQRPNEGKVKFRAAFEGLFKVDAERLYRINALEVPCLPTIHTNTHVRKGTQVAAFRILPLTCPRSIVDQVAGLLATPLLTVKPFVLKTAAIVVTGNEVYEGRIEDAFIPRLKDKIDQYGLDLTDTAILPDDRERIARTVAEFSASSDIVFVTGGTSVDPDDVTVAALTDAGVAYDARGAPLQPGNNFTVGHRDTTVICAIPAAAVFFEVTALDVLFPRLMAGERINKHELFGMGHGGLCYHCGECHFPVCPLGK